MMKNLTLKTKLQNEVHNGLEWLKLHLKDNINSSICYHTYKRNIKRLRLKAFHFPYVVTHIEGTSESEY